uniref:Uncharacterized protein n=1 Tax=Nelumbo nucifera TaxID=4432 RepID=A0A822XJM4_NELNU|nr:TPA_asm: hypothetical protein HUJ06_020722 [Nelumbo nucifera]
MGHLTHLDPLLNWMGMSGWFGWIKWVGVKFSSPSSTSYLFPL